LVPHNFADSSDGRLAWDDQESAANPSCRAPGIASGSVHLKEIPGRPGWPSASIRQTLGIETEPRRLRGGSCCAPTTAVGRGGRLRSQAELPRRRPQRPFTADLEAECVTAGRLIPSVSSAGASSPAHREAQPPDPWRLICVSRLRRVRELFCLEVEVEYEWAETYITRTGPQCWRSRDLDTRGCARTRETSRRPRPDNNLRTHVRQRDPGTLLTRSDHKVQAKRPRLAGHAGARLQGEVARSTRKGGGLDGS
jgi:hypothetical protein